MRFKEVKYKHVGTEKEQIRIQKIQRASRGMKNNTAPGPGGIFIELIKRAPKMVWDVIAGIFNNCLHRGEVPKEWKVTDVRVILTPGKPLQRDMCNQFFG